jgi:hypothetical protein
MASPGTPQRYGAAVQQDIAGIRPAKASQHFHQRRFAGAVLSQDRVDLARPERDRNVHEGPRAAEGFFETARRENGAVGGTTRFQSELGHS